MKIDSHPLRVTATRMPMSAPRERDRLRDRGKQGVDREAHPDAANTAGKMRPPRNPQVAATNIATSLTTV